MSVQMDRGGWLVRWRDGGISQIQLADATGFMQSWISNVEHGRRNPSWNNAVRLAEGLGVSLSELAAHAEGCARERS